MVRGMSIRNAAPVVRGGASIAGAIRTRLRSRAELRNAVVTARELLQKARPWRWHAMRMSAGDDMPFEVVFVGHVGGMGNVRSLIRPGAAVEDMGLRELAQRATWTTASCSPMRRCPARCACPRTCSRWSI
jgi:hypothetical protein